MGQIREVYKVVRRIGNELVSLTTFGTDFEVVYQIGEKVYPPEFGRLLNFPLTAFGSYKIARDFVDFHALNNVEIYRAKAEITQPSKYFRFLNMDDLSKIAYYLENNQISAVKAILKYFVENEIYRFDRDRFLSKTLFCKWIELIERCEYDPLWKRKGGK